MMHLPEINAAKCDSEGHFNFTPFFAKVAPIISQADIAIANFESTFGGKPYSGYPRFSAPDTVAYFIKEMGFDIICTANNHSADKGKAGINGTIDGFEKAGVIQTGTFKDSATKRKHYPLMVDKNGIRFALLNYTFSTNGIPVPKPCIVNDIDTLQMALDIAEAHKKKAEYIIAFMHWGVEYQRKQNSEQERVARWCLSHGIDAVIGSHPHVLQPVEYVSYLKDSVKKNGLVAYSLGNFVSNQRDRYTDGAMTFECNLVKNKKTGKIRLEQTGFTPVYVHKTFNPITYTVYPASYENDSNISMSEADRERMKNCFRDTRELISNDSFHITEKLYEVK